MRGLVIRWVISAIALLLTAQVMGKWEIEGGIATALVVALVLGVVNAVIRPLILFVTLPINVVSLGLFTFVVNGLMLKIVDYAMAENFYTGGFLSTIIGAIVLSVFSMIGSSLIKDKGEKC